MKSRVLRALYGLPLDIKLYIFQMVIRDHMKEWEIDHRNRSTPILRDLTASIFWDLYAPDRDSYIPDKTRVCDLVTDDKVTKYEIDTVTYWPHGEMARWVPSDHDPDFRYIYREIEDRANQHMHTDSPTIPRDKRMECNSPKVYWAANKCRCLTCDLVRLAHRQSVEIQYAWLELHRAKHEYYQSEVYGSDWYRSFLDKNKTYESITYETGDKQWKTMTASQVKTRREKRRSRRRNMEYMKGWRVAVQSLHATLPRARGHRRGPYVWVM